MRSYPQFDHHCTAISRHICRAAARLHIPLEYNIGRWYFGETEENNRLTYPTPAFWKIAANEGCTAIIGLDAHDYRELADPRGYLKAQNDLKAYGIPVITTLPTGR